jgi:hypothetical protein
MKPQSGTNPTLHQGSHEMLLRLLKVAEVLNKGALKSERHGIAVDKLGSTSTFEENEFKNHNALNSCNL